MHELIKIAFEEDLPKGDVTTDNLGLKNKSARARIIAKEDLVVSGTEVFEKCHRHIDRQTSIKWFFKDGDLLLNGQTLCTLEGTSSSLLKAERVALNFLGRLSGIATLTQCFAKEVRHTKCKILDTRKTTPGLRELEKLAVSHGGGWNHRANLSEAVLIKENHITQANSSIKEAVQTIQKNYVGFIEVEVKNLEEVKEVASLKINRVMLDNMDNDTIKEALTLLPSTIEVEASGNMSLDRVQAVAELGVDFISVGALTHSAPCADFSLLFEEEIPV